MRRESGLTLTEIIVSLAILALAAAGLGRMQMGSVSLAAENRIKLRAMSYAADEAFRLQSERFLDGSSNESSGSLTGVSGAETGLSYRASAKSDSYSGIPVRVMILSVEYGGREYVRYKTFKIQGL